jgi:hypothetical protein
MPTTEGIGLRSSASLDSTSSAATTGSPATTGAGACAPCLRRFARAPINSSQIEWKHSFRATESALDAQLSSADDAAAARDAHRWK